MRSPRHPLTVPVTRAVKLWIAEWVGEPGHSQRRLAELSGLMPATIAAVKRGRALSVHNLGSLMEVFGKTLGDLWEEICRLEGHPPPWQPEPEEPPAERALPPDVAAILLEKDREIYELRTGRKRGRLSARELMELADQLAPLLRRGAGTDEPPDDDGGGEDATGGEGGRSGGE